MFMFPEPPPVDYYITDVSQAYLSDGIFHHGNPAPTHKYVAKQLKPIKRTLSDPVAPIQVLDSRTLNQWIKKEKEGYVDPCGRDDGMVYETLKLMPKWKRDRHTSHSSPFSIFPRSPQYELWYIRDKRLKEFAKRKVTTVECPKREETTKTNDACGLLKPPFWWKDKTTRLRSFPVGNIDDYRFEKLKESVQDTGKISERLRLDHPKKYIPGAIHRIKAQELKRFIHRNVARKHRVCEIKYPEYYMNEDSYGGHNDATQLANAYVNFLSVYEAFYGVKITACQSIIKDQAIEFEQNPEDTSMKDTLDQADAFKVVLRMDETLPDADPSIDKCDCPARRRPRVPVIRGSKWNQCARDADKTLLDRDERWQSLCEEIDFSGTDLERQEELRKLTKPFLHDLHTWYSRNKPTKLILSVR